ncbi:hypothetical protein J6590_007963 [Homalodisca vitripennis]|nr:hypothetical protein J6590_007963 [Homalodisca vitripennis]
MRRLTHVLPDARHVFYVDVPAPFDGLGDAAPGQGSTPAAVNSQAAEDESRRRQMPYLTPSGSGAVLAVLRSIFATTLGSIRSSSGGGEVAAGIAQPGGGSTAQPTFAE